MSYQATAADYVSSPRCIVLAHSKNLGCGGQGPKVLKKKAQDVREKLANSKKPLTQLCALVGSVGEAWTKERRGIALSLYGRDKEFLKMLNDQLRKEKGSRQAPEWREGILEAVEKALE